MNELLKNTIIDTIKRNNVVLTRHPGIDEYIIKDRNGKILMEYTNGWDCGLYTLNINGITFSIEYYENAHKEKTQKEKDMFDILHAVCDRHTYLQRTYNENKHITKIEQSLIDFLNGKRTEKIK